MRFPLRVRRACACVAALALPSHMALAQNGGERYPNRPVRMIVPNLAGSATDATARMLAQRFSEMWGQQVVVDNRAGASGVIAHEIAARAVPDGYTILLSTSAGIVITPLLGKVPYDSFRDFAPVSLVVNSPLMLVVHPSVAATTVSELVALARARPGYLSCASPGTATANHLGCELLKAMTKVDILHVPYKGASLAITDLVGGQVLMTLNSMSAVWPLVKAGKLRAIAYAGVKRTSGAPDVPTVAETLPGFQSAAWYALVTTSGTPGAIVTRLNTDTVKVLHDPAFTKRLIEQGQDPLPGTPAELTAFMRAESARWAGVLKVAGMLGAK